MDCLCNKSMYLYIWTDKKHENTGEPHWTFPTYTHIESIKIYRWYLGLWLIPYINMQPSYYEQFEKKKK